MEKLIFTLLKAVSVKLKPEYINISVLLYFYYYQNNECNPSFFCLHTTQSAIAINIF